MLSTIILLYALDTGQIPIGCYIAAWTAFVIETAVTIVKSRRKNSNHKTD